MEAPLLPNKEDIEDVCISALKEKDIEAKLKLVTSDWTLQELKFQTFKNRGELLLRGDTTAETVGHYRAMEYSTMQYSAMQYSAMQCSAVHCKRISSVRWNALQWNLVQCSTEQWNAVQCSAVASCSFSQFAGGSGRGQPDGAGQSPVQQVILTCPHVLHLHLFLARYNAPFKKDIQKWVSDLSNTNEILERWLLVQNMSVSMSSCPRISQPPQVDLPGGRLRGRRHRQAAAQGGQALQQDRPELGEADDPGPRHPRRGHLLRGGRGPQGAAAAHAGGPAPGYTTQC